MECTQQLPNLRSAWVSVILVRLALKTNLVRIAVAIGSQLTCARRSGMTREFIQELRGDVRKEAIDIYDHIDKKELRESYLAYIPQLGI